MPLVLPSSSPTITAMRVIPVAGRDSMLLNLCGAHGPFFIRNLVLLESSDGRLGVGEVPGGEGILKALQKAVPLVEGTEVARYQRTLNAIRASHGAGTGTMQHQVSSAAEAAVLRQPHEINLRLDNVITAVEAALLDLLGQHLGERLTREPLQIVDGAVAVPDRPGLGIEPDLDRIEGAHALYKQVATGARDDAMAMRYLFPDWTYDPKRPSYAR